MNLSLLHITNEKPWGWVHQKWKIHSLTSHPNVDGKITTNQQPHQKKRLWKPQDPRIDLRRYYLQPLSPGRACEPTSDIEIWVLKKKRVKINQHGILGLSETWITPYKVNGIILCFLSFVFLNFWNKFPSPSVTQMLQKCLADWASLPNFPSAWGCDGSWAKYSWAVNSSPPIY